MRGALPTLSITMLRLAFAVAALLACAAGKHIAEDPYQHTLLKHHSFKTPDQIRSPAPLFDIQDGRDNSCVEITKCFPLY